MRQRFAAACLAAALIAPLFLVACSQQEQTPAASNPGERSQNAAANASNPDPNRQIFEVRGVVQEVKPEESEAKIKHERVLNPDGTEYMPAMTMSLAVKDTNELAGLAPNDEITFRMVVTEDDGWIENIQEIGVNTNAAARPAVRVVRNVEQLEVGDKMPNYTFTNSLGEKFSLGDLQGQAYAFTFIFTRCPFPTFCPRMNSNFAEAYKLLKETPNAPTNWHLISISFDPEFDTPERLLAYSKQYKPDPQKWSWVTGSMMDIDAITEQVGVVFAAENNTINHNLRTVIVDKNGVIRQNFWGNEWTTEQLVKEIIAGAEGKPVGQY